MMRTPRRMRWLQAAVLTAFCASAALAQGLDPKRPHQSKPGTSAAVPSGPINVPTYSPPIGGYPANPIHPPSLTPPHHSRPGDRHVHPPIIIAPVVGLPVSPTFGSGPIGADGAQYAYYCPYLGTYYPHVTHCPSAWVVVGPQSTHR